MNRVNLVGRIGNELVLEKTKTGKDVVKMRVAVRRNAEVDDWFNLVAYNKTAENIVRFFSIGNLIGIDGQLFTEQYEKDGKKISNTKVLVTEFTFCQNSQKQDNPKQKTSFTLKEVSEMPTDIDISNEDLPF